VNNKEFISELINRTGYDEADVLHYTRTVIDAMTETLEAGNSVNVPAFGCFETKKKLERIVVNPATQQRMLVPPKLVLAFHPAVTLKDELK
jgi:DNA-binding protein HU-beta